MPVQRCSGDRSSRHNAEAPAISVIVPALNAAAGLPACLQALRECDLLQEVIVVDGGSFDGTREIAAAAGATCLSAQPGRGTQLAVGAEAAKGPWLLFLHADTQLEPNWREAVRAFLNMPDAARHAAYFRFKLNARGWPPRILELAVALRCRLFALSYGDQGLLIHRDLYRAVGGFLPIQLMEDVAMWRQLHAYWRRQNRGRNGRLHRLPATAYTSADKYLRDGYLQRSLINLQCLWMYFRGVPPSVIADHYQRRVVR